MLARNIIMAVTAMAEALWNSACLGCHWLRVFNFGKHKSQLRHGNWSSKQLQGDCSTSRMVYSNMCQHTEQKWSQKSYTSEDRQWVQKTHSYSGTGEGGVIQRQLLIEGKKIFLFKSPPDLDLLFSLSTNDQIKNVVPLRNSSLKSLYVQTTIQRLFSSSSR